MRPIALILLALCGAAQAQTALDIIRRSVERDSTNFERLKDYTYQERQEERELDADGNVKKSDAETHDVLILGGRPYERLIARDDKPLSARDAQKEQEKEDRELERREHLSASDRAKLDKNREETRKFLRELPDAFQFRLLGQENVSGKPAWKIECEPNPDYRPRDAGAKLLTRLRGTLWVDQGEYQWVKAEMQVTGAVSFGLGLLRLAPGGSISFEQTRVNDEVWLPTRALIRADARLAYVKKVRAEIDITYRDYKKFQTDSRLVAEQK